jgi:two-component system sensor histidine kinase CpxA
VLTAATDRLAEGKFATRAAVHGADEIGRLGGAINGMAQRLESHAEAQKRFLGDVAHELGSPLGRLQVAVELLEQRAPQPLQPAVADVREEVQQMAELVGELLAFTRAGLQAPAAARTAVPLAPLVAEALAREDADARVVVSVPTDLIARGDAALLRRAIGNLVRNALRYGGGTGVRVSASRAGEHLHVRVEDDGPGVPPEALARLGEPFFRPESARARESGGVGLGLTIVRSSIAACGGEVHFANREPQGFRAELRLAAAD